MKILAILGLSAIAAWAGPWSFPAVLLGVVLIVAGTPSK